MGSASVDPLQLVEVKQTLDALTASVQGIAAALQQLTEASQASLGFAAKQTFDCPECQSHGTVSVPITCTHCGFESEWGFYPEQ
jgi:RecJ-like exonuclease